MAEASDLVQSPMGRPQGRWNESRKVVTGSLEGNQENMSLDRLNRKLAYSALIALLALMVTENASAATPSLAAAASHGMSLNASGNACGAGENNYGELGDGTAVARWTPVPVVGLSSAIKGISTGQYHTVAVKNDGTVWTWGYNGYGQLGTGNNYDRLTPFSISGVSSVV